MLPHLTLVAALLGGHPPASWPALSAPCCPPPGPLAVSAPAHLPTAVDPDSTPGFWSAAGDAGLAILDDTWSVLKATVAVENYNWPVLAGVGTMGATLFFFDEEIDALVRNSLDEPVGETLEGIGDFLEPLGNVGGPTVVMAGGWVVAELAGQRRVALVLQELVNAQLISTTTRHLARYVIGRSRPRDGEGAYSFTFGEGTSMPSGHAATAAQLAHILSHHIDNPWATGILWAGASTVMFQRLASGAHWASDVWVGAFWGVGIAEVVMRSREAEWVAAAPLVDPETGALGIQVRLAVP